MKIPARIRPLLFVLSMMVVLPSSAQASGVLSGRVVDANRDYALSGVIVTIEGTNRRATSDREGQFRIEGLPQGSYTVVADYLGYGAERVQVDVRSGSNPALRVGLTPESSASLETIVVTAAREGTSRALNQQRAADNMKSVVAADFVGQFPDKNIAEATQRLPGIGIQRDQGEGRFVNIRGTPVEFANVSVDGVTVPSPNSGTRAVDLDTIPSDIISLLEVSKTLTPDMDAEAIAGNINIVTQGAFDANRRFLRVSAAGGQNVQGKGGREEYSATFGDVFGPEQNFGIIIGGNFSRTERATDNVEHDWERVNPGGLLADPILLMDETELKDYPSVERERSGLNLRLDYKVSEQDRVYFSYSRSKFEDAEIRQETAIDWSGGDYRAGATPGSGIVDRVRVTKELRDRTVTNEIDIFTLGSTSYIGDGRLDLRASYAESEQFHPIRTQLAYRTGRNTIAYDFSDTDFPVFTLLDGDDQPVPGNLRALEDDLEFRQWRPRPTVAAEEQELALQADFELPLTAFSNETVLKVGAKTRLRQKENEEFRTQNRDGRNAPSFSELAADTDSNNFGRFNTGRRFRSDTIRMLDASGAFDDEFTQPRIEQSIVADYDVEEDIYAGYGMLTSYLGSAVTIVGGLRVEYTDYSGNANEFDEDLEVAVPVSSGASYTRLFPSLMARWEAQPDLILRAAFTTGLSRPNFEVLAPFAIVAEDDDEVERGNPDLDPTYSYNFDLMAEYYLRPAGLVSAGLFYKRLEDTIFVAESVVQGGRFDGFLQERPENGGNGEVYGAELSWSQNFDFLPFPFNGLGVNANYTFTKSDADKPFGLGSSDLPGTSRHTSNLSLFYEYDKFSGRIAYNKRSKYLNSFNVGDPELDNFWDEREVVDATASFQVTEQFRLFGEVSNITDTRQRRFDGIRARVNELEQFGRSWIVGLRYTY